MTKTCTYPRFEGGEAKSHSNSGFVGVHHRVVVNVTMVAYSDWFVVILMDPVERVDWF